MRPFDSRARSPRRAFLSKYGRIQESEFLVVVIPKQYVSYGLSSKADLFQEEFAASFFIAPGRTPQSLVSATTMRCFKPYLIVSSSRLELSKVYAASSDLDAPKPECMESISQQRLGIVLNAHHPSASHGNVI